MAFFNTTAQCLCPQSGTHRFPKMSQVRRAIKIKSLFPQQVFITHSACCVFHCFKSAMFSSICKFLIGTTRKAIVLTFLVTLGSTASLRACYWVFYSVESVSLMQLFSPSFFLVTIISLRLSLYPIFLFIRARDKQTFITAHCLHHSI